MYSTIFLSLFLSLRHVRGHQAFWHPSMWGYNVSDKTFDYDNRPVVPLMGRTFDKWWFHGHLGYPPHQEDVFDLPAGQVATSQIACDKSATTWWKTSPSGGNIQLPNDPNDPCPGAPMRQYHTTGLDDVKGCALAIAYKSDVSDVKPADFTIFSVNHTCVWSRYTDFAVPERMPACPNDMCICAFFWIHSPDSGSEQNYMNGFQCKISNPTSNVPLATPQLARRCGADPANKKSAAAPGNCTYGAKQPLYWFQAEQNNMFEGTYAPPYYNDLYNFPDGAQNDIFQDSYENMPIPGPSQTALPVLAALGGALGGAPSTTASDVGATTPALSTPTSSASVPPLSAAPSSSPSASDGTTPAYSAPTSAAPSSLPSASNAGDTTAPALSTPSGNAPWPSATPSSPSGSQCKRNASAFSRRQVPVERGTTHKTVGKARHRRSNPH